MMTLEWIGWVATAVFASSYFAREPATLRRLQAVAAVLWIAYGVTMKAPPVVVANVIVATLALWSSMGVRSRAVVEASAPPESGAA